MERREYVSIACTVLLLPSHQKYRMVNLLFLAGRFCLSKQQRIVRLRNVKHEIEHRTPDSKSYWTPTWAAIFPEEEY